MDELVFDIDKAAINHYRYRLKTLIEKKENKEIKPILEKQTEGLFKLLDEMYTCFDEKNDGERRNQWDRYVYVLCKALLMYNEDLEKSKTIMSEFGSEKTGLNIRKLEEYLERIESRIGTLHKTILELQEYPHLATF